MTTAYLIDPQARTVTQVEYTGDYRNIYEHIGADCFDVARVYQNGDGIFVDDEGLLKDPEHFFVHRNYASPLAGKGLLLGCNEEGESVAPATDFETFKNDIAFVSRDEVLAMLKEAA
jgi:hypothetical protein